MTRYSCNGASYSGLNRLSHSKRSRSINKSMDIPDITHLHLPPRQASAVVHTTSRRTQPAPLQPLVLAVEPRTSCRPDSWGVGVNVVNGVNDDNDVNGSMMSICQ